MSSVLESWIGSYEQLLLKGAQAAPVAGVARRMYNLCISQSSASIAALREIMETLGIPWPDPPNGDTSPLRVVLESAYRFQIHLWFDIRLMPRSTSLGARLPFIHLRPSDHIITSFQEHQTVLASGAYTKYWRQFYGVFRDSKSATIPPEEFIDSTRVVQTFVFQTLFNVTTGTAAEGPKRIPVSSLGVYTGKLSSEEWKKELTNAFPMVDISDEDLVSVSDVSILRSIGAIFNSFSSTQILYQVGWQVAQMYGPLADFNLMIAKYGDSTEAQSTLPAVCAKEVDGAFRGLAATLVRTPEAEFKLRGVLKNILETTASMITEATWLHKWMKDIAVSKLWSMRIVLWQTFGLFKNTLVNDIYKNYTDNATSMFEFMLLSSAALHALRNAVPQGTVDILMFPDTVSLPLFIYDRALNELSVRASAIQPPLYSGTGTKVMTYAGLGFLFTQHLFYALDELGRQVLPNRTIDEGKNGTCFSSAFTAALEKTFPCLQTMPDEHFSNHLALKVTFAALQKDVSEEEELPVDPLFTDEEIFYMGICYLMCHLPGALDFLFTDCNKALSNFPPFAKSYGCKIGSKMNPENKCTFFD
ncbi:hypothetical protein HPB48_006087 [Haemaphysalis longicornis]|uniref:Peptidase M13 C-terminal domain-containing protein n=1 Tax=Haemaphysalis longicornis TaxID=44386 RepID=A0A9J6GSF2_HAELO|nr:hypothetical protein HPB48_006087 [Haemaphysalis longicornis]